jgi:hypothetical protein
MKHIIIFLIFGIFLSSCCKFDIIENDNPINKEQFISNLNSFTKPLYCVYVDSNQIILDNGVKYDFKYSNDSVKNIFKNLYIGDLFLDKGEYINNNYEIFRKNKNNDFYLVFYWDKYYSNNYNYIIIDGKDNVDIFIKNINNEYNIEYYKIDKNLKGKL